MRVPETTRASDEVTRHAGRRLGSAEAARAVTHVDAKFAASRWLGADDVDVAVALGGAQANALAHDRQILPEKVRLALFRIFQQSLANVIRHSKATEVHVRFSFDAEEAHLEIKDNGKGFEVPQNWIDFVRQGHYGLAGAAERANTLGGVFKVQSKPGNSTTIQVTIPWKDSAD